jgi:hypothetical protein
MFNNIALQATTFCTNSGGRGGSIATTFCTNSGGRGGSIQFKLEFIA